MKLVIVESPAKARTIAGFLGSGFVVESSIGHVRDLPRKAEEIPAAQRSEGWARLGVDVDNDFKPLYVVPAERRKQISHLKSLLKDADELYLATDEDREGESIAWHLLEVLKPKVPVRRMVFHEITADAIRRAVETPRQLDRRLVDAQETRRILDRLVGYEVSPVLWRLIRPRLSAGRVQSPAIRLVVERERERMEFQAAGYWSVDGRFTVDAGGFEATLHSLDGVRVAVGRDFDAAGALRSGGGSETGAEESAPTEAAPSDEGSGGDVVVLDADAARAVVTDLEGATLEIRSLVRKPYTRKPQPPFRTSTLQQEAGRKLRLGSQQTMRLAQRLYENGFITYMRTDSTSLSDAAVAAARSQAVSLFGAEFVPDRPRLYASKVKNAQEAHEAIRPAGESFRTPDQVRRHLSRDEAALYDLIWKRTVASQMQDAKGESLSVRLGGVGASGRDAEFATSGRTITFPGFLRAYVQGSDDPEAELEDRERRLPSMSEGEAVAIESLEAVGHETRPPARYTEASLVQKLEELGIGRPSTYAAIIQTILDRGYVTKSGAALVPTADAFSTVGLLERHFGHLVEYEFTARLEEELDEIARGEGEMVPYLEEFYRGNGHPGLKEVVAQAIAGGDAREINTILLPGIDGVVVRNGRYGPYLETGDGRRASIPEGTSLDDLTPENVLRILEAPQGDRALGTDPETGLTVFVRTGRFGPYVQLGEDPGEDADLQPDAAVAPDASEDPVSGAAKAPAPKKSPPKRGRSTAAKPKRASLFASMSPETVTLEEALALLALPRVVGVDPSTGDEILATNGRYGPYIKRGDDTRSLAGEAQILTVTLDEAVDLLAQPKRGRGRAAASPGRIVGVDPGTGWQITVRSGRFGPYVTDGGVNASLRTGDSPETITPERASELLAARRARLESEGKPVTDGKPPAA